MGFLLIFYKKSLQTTLPWNTTAHPQPSKEEHSLHCMAKPEFVQGLNQGKAGMLHVWGDKLAKGALRDKKRYLVAPTCK